MAEEDDEASRMGGRGGGGEVNEWGGAPEEGDDPIDDRTQDTGDGLYMAGCGVVPVVIVI